MSVVRDSWRPFVRRPKAAEGLKKLSNGCSIMLASKVLRSLKLNQLSRPQLHLQLRPRGARVCKRMKPTTRPLLRDDSAKDSEDHHRGSRGSEKRKSRQVMLVMLKAKNKNEAPQDKSVELMLMSRMRWRKLMKDQP